MIKKIDPKAIAFLLEVGITKAGIELEKGFNNYPESPGGVEVDWVDLRNHFDTLVASVRASASNLLGELPYIDTPIIEPIIEPVTSLTELEKGKYHGRHNGDRPMWYFTKDLKDYPQQFIVVIDGCSTVNIDGHDGIRIVVGSTIVKQSDVSGRGMAVVTGSHCRSTSCHIILSTKNIKEPNFNTIDVIQNLRFMYDKSFTWLPYTGGAYGRIAKFVWPELNTSFLIPDMSNDYSPKGQDHETYFCGTNNALEVSNGRRASIFGPAGKKASFVEIHYNK